MALDCAARGGRLHQSWLLAGPPGVGKAMVARRFAAVLMDPESRRDGDALAVDPGRPVARLVAKGTHPDLRLVAVGTDPKTGKPQSVIPVAVIRTIGAFLRMTPSLGGRRVVIIDGAEDMNINASNALLKVLEEPPRDAVMVLVTHAPGRLLPTIRSRCCRIVMPALGDGDVDAILAGLRPDLPAAERAAVVRLADGSAGRAVTVADAGGIDLLRLVLETVAAGDRTGLLPVHALADQLSRRGADTAYDTALGLFRWWLGRVVRAAAGCRDRPVFDDGTPDRETERRAAAVLRERMSPASLADLWSQVGAHLTAQTLSTLDRKQSVITLFSLLSPP